MDRLRWIGSVLIVAATWWVAAGGDSLLRALWPAIVAIGVIVLLKEAVAGLACGVAAAALLLAGGDPVKALRLALADHVFPSLEDPWRIGALVFTLLLGSFAAVLERSGATCLRWRDGNRPSAQCL